MIDCVFCARVANADFEYAWKHAVAFAPLNPVTPGHMLVVPRVHVPDFASNPFVTARVIKAAALLAGNLFEDCNLITSRGSAATQSVFHLHIHLVPRHAGDGLALPWTSP